MSRCSFRRAVKRLQTLETQERTRRRGPWPASCEVCRGRGSVMGMICLMCKGFGRAMRPDRSRLGSEPGSETVHAQ